MNQIKKEGASCKNCGHLKPCQYSTSHGKWHTVWCQEWTSWKKSKKKCKVCGNNMAFEYGPVPQDHKGKVPKRYVCYSKTCWRDDDRDRT